MALLLFMADYYTVSAQTKLSSYSSHTNSISRLLILPPILHPILHPTESDTTDSELPVAVSYIIHNKDTTWVWHNPTLEEITVTPQGGHSGGAALPVPAELRMSRQTLSQGNPLFRLAAESEISPGVSRFTAELQRDLPSMIRFYTPQGIPMLVKYTSNNSLTTTIPNTGTRLEVKEPGAYFPSPDAPIIIQPDYSRRRAISLTPFKQTLGFSGGGQNLLAVSAGAEHSGAPGSLERLVPELETFSTTYSMHGSARVGRRGSSLEAVARHSRSDNEFGGLLGIDHLMENEENTFLHLHGEQRLGPFTLDAGAAYQTGTTWREVEELEKWYEDQHEITATTLTAAVAAPVGRTLTRLRINHHDLIRVYNDTSAHLNRFESVLTHTLPLNRALLLSVETRYDHADREPSVSGEMMVQPVRWLRVELNGAWLYDAIGSEALNSSFRNAQTVPHPWRSTYVRIGTQVLLETIALHASLMNKSVRVGWYEESATMEGWISRFGINGTVEGRRFYKSWRLQGAVRDLKLIVPLEGAQLLPGPARLEGNAAWEMGTKRFQYAVQANVFIDRSQIVRTGINQHLGSQYFLSLGVSTAVRSVHLGASLENILAFFGVRSKLAAYTVGRNDIRFAYAPPVPSLSMNVEF